MAFWSGETLTRKLGNLIVPFDPSCVQCASYELSVGNQAFVTKDDLIGGDAGTSLTHVLESAPPSNTVIIKPGQFAFLLTEETIEVPTNALALISMKAKLKFRGLINVSGFHVDPGFRGKLVFSMYNAGPREIILNRGQRIFIIVYADLDQASIPPFVYNGGSQGQSSIKAEMIEHISSGQVFSPMRLQTEMSAIRSDLTEVRIRARLIDGIVLASIGIFVSIVVAVGAALFGSDTALATVGWWMKNAINVYDGRAAPGQSGGPGGKGSKLGDEVLKPQRQNDAAPNSAGAN
jgi:dCTP deaminase